MSPQPVLLLQVIQVYIGIMLPVNLSDRSAVARRIFRLHGDRGGPKDVTHCSADGFNEVWTFGDIAYTGKHTGKLRLLVMSRSASDRWFVFAAISSVMRLREDLRDYVSSQAICRCLWRMVLL